MDVIYDVITERELAQFCEEDWCLLCSLLDDTLSLLIKQYMQSNNCDAAVKSECEKYLGDTVKSYTFHLEVAERNIVALVREVQPETILLNSPAYLANIKEQFQFLQENYSKIRTFIPARKKQDWDMFLANMSQRPFSTPEFTKKLRVNKQIFCLTREVDRVLPTKYLVAAKSKWEMALKAILYDEECKRTGNTNYDLMGRLRFF